MKTHAGKTQENKGKSVSAAGSQMQSRSEPTFKFFDNRPEAVAQRKLQEMANNRPQVSQLKAFRDMANNSPQAKQAAQLQEMANSHTQKNAFQFFDNRTEALAQRKMRERVDSSPRMVSRQEQIGRMLNKATQRQEAPQEGELHMKARQGQPLQMKAYSVSRRLPLEPHFKETAANDTTDLGRDLLGKVRQGFPLSAEDEQRASSEQWNADKRDEHRPEGFTQAKVKVMSQLVPYSDAQGVSTSVWTRGAHISGLSVASERSRANTPESALTKNVTKMDDWIGAHLVKREWGGEDNMWNVVSWPKAAEDTWGKGFEKPIDNAFAVGGQRKLNIDIQIDKEDEAVPRVELNAMLLEAAPKEFSGTESDIPASTKSMAAEAWHITNRGLESIPTSARGGSELGSATLNSGDTNWAVAKAAAKVELRKGLERRWNVNSQNHHATNSDPEGSRATEKRVNERSQALEKERVNYRPERYEVTHDISNP